MSYMIGQRVLLNGKVIGTVVKPEHNNSNPDYVWVFNPENDYPSAYDPRNVQPLPNGQL